MTKRKGPSLSATGNPHFCTPQWILEPIRDLDPRRQIALDPCSNRNSIVNARVEWYGPRARSCRGDGLRLPWGATARAAALRRTPLVYVNPPFTRGIVGQWVAKCAAEALDELRPMHITALVPARLSASWFRRDCYPGGDSARAICFLGRRVRFIGAESPCPWEMAVVYWGPYPTLFARCLQPVGAVYANLSGGLEVTYWEAAAGHGEQVDSVA
jgi:hypothetical protein